MLFGEGVEAGRAEVGDLGGGVGVYYYYVVGGVGLGLLGGGEELRVAGLEAAGGGCAVGGVEQQRGVGQRIYQLCYVCEIVADVADRARIEFFVDRRIDVELAHRAGEGHVGLVELVH